MIQNVTMKPNKGNFLVVSDSKTVLYFHANTTVEKLEADSGEISKYKFDFFDFDKFHL